MRIKEIELATGNLAKVETFYLKVLQLPLVQRQPGRLSFAAGYSLIHFNAAEAPAGIYHFAFLIPPHLFLTAYQQIKSQIDVLPFSDENDIADFANWNAKAFYFHDEEENILEFIAHYDLVESSEDELPANFVKGIAEIGIGVNDVEGTCAELHTIYNIPYYRKGPRFQNFAVMGEEEGLIIVSALGRGWIPTGQAATNSKVKIVLEIQDKEITLQC